jgi:hypothetical protein
MALNTLPLIPPIPFLRLGSSQTLVVIAKRSE